MNEIIRAVVLVLALSGGALIDHRAALPLRAESSWTMAMDDSPLRHIRPDSARTDPTSEGSRLDGRSRSVRRSDLGRISMRMDSASRRIRSLERIADDLKVWFGCVSFLRVDQMGDRDHGWGFRYDERDGTGIDTRPALVRHVGESRPDLVMLRMARRVECLSAAPDPNGTGEDARSATGQALLVPNARGASHPTLLKLERRLQRLDRRIHRLDRAFDRFDDWESCLSWLPVTELGDEYQNIGFVVDPADAQPGTTQQHLPAIDIDTSEWDDPDYQFLAFLGRDRPFTDVECGHEPGEGVDRVVAPAQGGPLSTRPIASTDRLGDLRGDLRSAEEDVEDLGEPAAEFVQFDECMFTIGLQERPGYQFIGSDGGTQHRTALSFDFGGLELPEFDVMGFPGEEPPQIECNEDAGGQDTDE